MAEMPPSRACEAEILEELTVCFTPAEWALMDPGQKALYEEVTREVNAMVAFLAEGPLEVLLDRLIAQKWEKDFKNWHEASQEGKNQTVALREKSGPREQSKCQTQKHKGKKARTSSEAGETLVSYSVLDASEGVNRAKLSPVCRINLSCSNFYRQEMLVKGWRSHARGPSSTVLNCGQNFCEESTSSQMRFYHEETVELDLSQHWISHAGENQKTEINWHQKDRTRAKQGKSLDCDVKSDQSKPSVLSETVPSGEKPYRCLECGVSFTLKSNLRRHEKFHTGEKSYKCSDCGKSFDRNERLISHRRVHTGETPYQCSECDKAYHAKEALRRHQRIHSTKLPSGEAANVCSKCGKIFRSKSDVVRHQTVHTRERPYMCPDCGKHFSQSGDLASHRRIHTGETPHPCVECGKSFRRRDMLIVHRRIHTGEKPYKCSECGKRFGRADVFSSHQKMHSGEKPFTCSECGKTFSQANNFRKHQIVHTGEKPYKCLECGKTFGYGSALTFHHKKHTIIDG